MFVYCDCFRLKTNATSFLMFVFSAELRYACVNCRAKFAAEYLSDVENSRVFTALHNPARSTA